MAGRNLLSRMRGAPVGQAIAAPMRPDQQRHALMLMEDYERSGLGWFWSTDRDGLVTYLSPWAAERLGKSPEQLMGAQFYALFAPDRDREDTAERTLPLILSAHKTFADRAVKVEHGDTAMWWAISGRPQFDKAGQFSGYRGNGADVTASRRTHLDASRLAMYDSLTGLANRHRMAQRLDATITAYRVSKRSCAVMMLDLDRFKQVNDTLGHPVGDELLKQVAQRLHQAIEHTCEIGRLGGDEFQVILPDIDDRGKLGDIARSIISMISQPYQIGGDRCIIGASVGIAIAPYDGISCDEVVRSADLALYAAKGGGRGTFRFYSSDLQDAAEQRRQLEDDLRDALQRGEISLAYQPIVSAANDTVVGLEAVMRWSHPEYGVLSPDLFIPIAEDSKLILGLGEWAMRRACEEVQRLPGNLRVAVNVSPTQFANPGFPAVVASVLASSRIDPDRLELELTESVFLHESDSNERTFADLKQLGVRLALDDFGTGYASLGYLRKAPFDKIKIDKTFINGATDPSTRNAAIITAIVSLTDALDLETTAEGVEAMDELELLRKLGVKTIQGFLYSPPLPFNEISAAMSANEWVIAPSGPTHQRSGRRTIFRKVGVIHEDFRYEVTMRNISRSGTMIEGLVDIPLDTQFVVDFGEGQLAIGIVRRSQGSVQGLSFEVPLVDDGAGGLCTRHRVSPYSLAAAGMPLAALPPGNYPLHPQAGGGEGGGGAKFVLPKFGTAPEKSRGRAA